MSNHRNDYDAMKDSLNKMRNFKAKPKLNEGVIANLQPAEIEDEKNKFKQAVSPNVEFGQFNSNTMEFSGVLLKEKISWIFSLTQNDGCIISCENLQLSDEALSTIQKLSAYYTEWSNYWGNATSN